MNNSVVRITAILFLISVAYIFRGDVAKLLRSSTAFAVGDLSVNWGVPEGQPIFTVSNMAPGQTRTRSAVVTNDAAVPRPLGVRGIKTSETGALASAISIVIKNNGTDVYGGSSVTGIKTLQQFFNENPLEGIFISNLASSASTKLAFITTLHPGSGNEFQSKNLTFSIQIGLSFPTPSECAQNNLDGDLIFGTQNSETLRGTTKGDLIFALEGNDTILGNGGDDCIVGGAGNDTLLGGAGNDTIIGNGGNDSVIGNIGNDTIYGNDGLDSISAGDGNDSIFGGDGIDSISAGNGDDILNGGAGIDSGTGGAGIDTCQELEFKVNCEL